MVAEPSHAGYVTRYISTRLAELAPLRRAYSFSRNFPQPQSVKDRRETDRLRELGAEPECHLRERQTVGLLIETWARTAASLRVSSSEVVAGASGFAPVMLALAIGELSLLEG
jgi:hypothetical protein